MFFLIAQIAIISLLIIYAAHIVWKYYTKNTDTKVEHKNVNSALQHSKKMYEDMARAIQISERSEVDTYNPATLEEEIIIQDKQKNNVVKSENNKNMQEELQMFMDNITEV